MRVLKTPGSLISLVFKIPRKWGYPADQKNAAVKLEGKFPCTAYYAREMRKADVALARLVVDHA